MSRRRSNAYGHSASMRRAGSKRDPASRIPNRSGASSPRCGGGMSGTPWPDPTGHFGPFGGRFVPETLILALDQLEAEYHRAENDPEFQVTLATELREFAGRPT